MVFVFRHESNSTASNNLHPALRQTLIPIVVNLWQKICESLCLVQRQTSLAEPGVHMQQYNRTIGGAMYCTLSEWRW